jgi:hypothetical protein
MGTRTLFFFSIYTDISNACAGNTIALANIINAFMI